MKPSLLHIKTLQFLVSIFCLLIKVNHILHFNETAFNLLATFLHVISIAAASLSLQYIGSELYCILL